MITVVAGIGRSGTSLMMRMLVESGIPAFYDRLREKALLRKNRPDYLVNESFFEVAPEDFMRLGFSRSIPDGHCCKLGLRGVPMLTPGDYKVILMRRDLREIRASFDTAGICSDFSEQWDESIELMFDEVKAIMTIRPDIDFIEVRYRELVDDPEGTIGRLRAFGVPIGDVAGIVDPALYRHRAA